MLRELKIENLAIIDRLNLNFEKGLIVLTGETGAGKSIILSGINLLIGEKASSDMIRDGKEMLMAQGVFAIDDEQKKEIEKLDLGIQLDDNELIIRRVYDITGKGKAFVNDTRVTLNTLKDITINLIDIVGQHSHQMLLNKSNHIKLLDKYLGEEGKISKRKVHDLCNTYYEITKKINTIETARKEMAEKKELYSFQLKEINDVDPKIGEDSDLEDEYKKLFNAGMIKDKLTEASEPFKGSQQNLLHNLHNTVKTLESIGKFSKEYEDISARIEKIYYDLEDCSDIMDTMIENIDTDDGELQNVIERLDKIKSLKLKYGATVEEIIAYKNDIESKINDFDNSGSQIEDLIIERKAVEDQYWIAAKELSQLRSQRSNQIKMQLEEELKQLKMESARFKCVINKKDKIDYDGIDEVEFFISTNVGSEEKPLSKIASGGEVSRMMLALKVIFSRVDNIPILIFDEIDTGVGGETVRKIADKLKDIGQHTQVIVITHSPMIAAKAGEQFFIRKEVKDNMTYSYVTKLDYQSRINEIARMLAGDNATESVLTHAKELLDEA